MSLIEFCSQWKSSQEQVDGWKCCSGWKRWYSSKKVNVKVVEHLYLCLVQVEYLHTVEQSGYNV